MKKHYLLILFCFIGIALTAQPVVSFTTLVNTGLTDPVDIVNAKDGSNRLFIVQQTGVIKIYSGGSMLATPFLDISSGGIITYDGSERGLLSLAFHPQYATNRYFFIWYNNAAGDVELAQMRTMAGNPNVADPASRKVIMTIAKPFTNHNGAKLNFGTDGNLYFGTGDGGSGGDPNNNAQNGQSLLGKMIRINVDDFTTPPYHHVPADNPFVGTATNNIMDSIYALGLRNPWRWSFDRLTGDMWIADVGQSAWEEVDFRTPANMSGVNYGWRCYEGNHEFNISQCGANPSAGKVFPIFEYPHDAATGGFVITGGYVYRGNEFLSLQGWYICCDYSTGNGWLIRPDGAGGWTTVMQNNFPTHISSFGEAEDGTLYAVRLDGVLYKVVSSAVTGIPVVPADDHKLGITPNPAGNTITIKAADLKYVRIFDLAGKQLIQKNISAGATSVEINIERLATGAYIVHAADKNGFIKTAKLQKH